MTVHAEILKRTQFGNPILQLKAKTLTQVDIKSAKIQQLIVDMRFTMQAQKFGVGLAAPQIGQSRALAIIIIRPTPARANQEFFEAVIINPTYIGIGEKEPMWEGCLSFSTKNSPVFAQAMRYSKIQASYFDEMGKLHKTSLEGLPAHVFQHETDHLDGILFPERVQDHRSWMNASEYKKRVVAKAKNSTKLSDTID